ncbi:hypothetical protein [Glycomyces xiaoerkulensis]|uniref:hypothetical protein n=1 Tax=Glycomyces xiaoerkulensis TaxID=2038139 RepID=UPI000C258B92|nr:hypothetical protein [Glycomyces xiaoerkulensis]
MWAVWARRPLVAFEIAVVVSGVAIRLAAAAVSGDPELTGVVITQLGSGLLDHCGPIGPVRTREMEQWCDRTRNDASPSDGSPAEEVR